jgi:DNA-binding transcriptional LysR family regulator
MIDRLEYFIALARSRHFGRAAEECGVTQPSFSAAIKQLEDCLGVMLVQRGSRFQGLTPEGERVLDWARRIVGDTRAMREEMRTARRGLGGRLRIAAIPTALPMIPRLIAPFRRRNPDVSFSVLSRTSGEVRLMIESFDTDLGVTYLAGDDPDGLALYRERYQCVTAADGPLAERDEVTWAEVLRQPLCLLTPDMQNRRIIEEMAASLGAPVEPVVESNSMLLLFGYLRAGRGASIMPLSLPDALSSAEDIRAIPIVEPDVSHTVGLVASGRAPHTPLVASFLADARRFRDAASDAPPPPRLSATPLAVVAGGARRR